MSPTKQQVQVLSKMYLMRDTHKVFFRPNNDNGKWEANTNAKPNSLRRQRKRKKMNLTDTQ